MIGWLDCASGASGDMLLGTLVAAGIDLADLQQAVDAVTPEPVRLRAESVTRGTLAATRVHVLGTESHVHRTWADLAPLLQVSGVPGIDRARSTFRRLVEAEGAVHGISPDEVHLHEVGALDAIADIVGVCAGFALLGLQRLHCSPVALGAGTVQAAHGRLPVPGPAVQLLIGSAPSYGGPVEVELLTPTGAALLAEHVDEWGPQPLLTDTRQAFGAGGRDLAEQPNVVRLITGTPWQTAEPGTRRHGPQGLTDLMELQATVDDLDPRLWPSVLEDLIGAGALDAWLAPVLMRKGRPGHVLHVLVPPGSADDVEQAVFALTTTLGVRRLPLTRRALERRVDTVEVAGHTIRVKVRDPHGPHRRSQVEWDDVLTAAEALGRPAREVLDQAVTSAHQLLHNTDTPPD